MRVTVIGAGSWGTTIAGILGKKNPVTLWVRREKLAKAIEHSRENAEYLPGMAVPETVTVTTDLREAASKMELLVMGVPSHQYRSVLEKAADYIPNDVPIVSLAKGIEARTLMRMTEVTIDILPTHDINRIGVLTGPNLAAEIAIGQPTASVIAMRDLEIASSLQNIFMTPALRVYTNEDVIGCEAAGALKNVMAIAAGMAQGLGFGDNTMATLITRSLAELTRLGVAMGGRPLTFSGLAGIGDLIATCTSQKSRNRTVGYNLGQGKKLEAILVETKEVAEGINSTRGVLDLAKQYEIEMPIAEQVGRVLYERVSPSDAVGVLMAREAKAEMEGID